MFVRNLWIFLVLSNKQLLQFKPFIDNYDLKTRVCKRLGQAEMPYHQKYPLFQTSTINVHSVMIRKEHIGLPYAGVQNVLYFRTRF